MTEHKTQLSQLYELFGGYSPGGFIRDETAYISLSDAEQAAKKSNVDWRARIDELNNSGQLIASKRVIILPDEEYKKVRNGTILRPDTSSYPVP